MYRVVIVGKTLTFTVVQSILELTDDIHENIKVYSSLLDGLIPSFQVVLGEVRATSVECSPPPFEGGLDPLVGVIVCAIVIVKVHEIGVWASLAAIPHLRFSSGRKPSNGAISLVISRNIVYVRLFFSVDGQNTISHKASVSHGIHQRTNSARHITLLHIGGRVINLNLLKTRFVIRSRLPVHLGASCVLSQNLFALFDIGCKANGEGDKRVGFGVSTLVVDLLGLLEGIGCHEGELGLHGGLIEIEGAVISHLRAWRVSSNVREGKMTTKLGHTGGSAIAVSVG
mmetsp:Transcript_29032/g.60474  ORF Transcript_29032/g.60474 Transcript_29032/m.60474 type:complete len:285 (+) Transcript_29032:557-1411(+)